MSANSTEKDYALASLQIDIKKSASWFYWICALSIVNSAIIAFGGEISFIIGLGFTQLIDGIAFELVNNQGAAGYVTYAALALSILTAGVFGLFGLAGNKRILSVYIIGIVLYTIDGLIFLTVQDWFSLGFHGFALFNLFRAIGAIKEYRKVEAAPVAEPAFAVEQPEALQ